MAVVDAVQRSNMRKRILLVTDVKGWGGWVRGMYIKRYLYEYDIRLMDAREFNDWELHVNSGYFSDKDLQDFRSKRFNFKKYYNFDAFRRFVEKQYPRPYDLHYFLFHTMLQKKSTQRLLNNGAKAMTIVTGFPTLKPCFGRVRPKDKFLHLARKCSAIGANNIKSLNDLKTIWQKKTFYAPRGVDPDIFYPMTTSFKRKDKFTVAYVGKPVPEKGLESIIRPACKKAGVELIINDRNYENALSPQQMNKFYNQADVYLVASTIDGTPNPALEAASCGKPIIANAIGNMPEFIRDGENGFMVDLKMDKYIQKLLWMKTNQMKSFEMGQEARKTILRKWTWEKVIDQHERKIFQELV
jgi:glycosyltransferase involved in cell wall biosynthesis